MRGNFDLMSGNVKCHKEGKTSIFTYRILSISNSLSVATEILLLLAIFLLVQTDPVQREHALLLYLLHHDRRGSFDRIKGGRCWSDGVSLLNLVRSLGKRTMLWPNDFLQRARHSFAK